MITDCITHDKAKARTQETRYWAYLLGHAQNGYNVEAARRKELSINSAYQVTKLPLEQQQEISERIQQGESPRKVVAEIRKNSPSPVPSPVPPSEPKNTSQPAPEIETEPQVKQETDCPLYIPFIEDAINSEHVPAQSITLNRFLLHGYEHSQSSGYDRLDLYDENFSAHDVEDISNTLREHDVLEFTISDVSKDILLHLADFQSHGFFVQQILTLRDNSPAILLRYSLVTATGNFRTHQAG